MIEIVVLYKVDRSGSKWIEVDRDFTKVDRDFTKVDRDFTKVDRSGSVFKSRLHTKRRT